MDKPFEIEARGAAEGINPMFGEWSQKFDLEPVSYSNPSPARVAFKQAIRDQLKNKFVFVGEARLTATLYLDEQKMLETPAYGDLDNYAKQLLDSLKGRGGLFIITTKGHIWTPPPSQAVFDGLCFHRSECSCPF